MREKRSPTEDKSLEFVKIQYRYFLLIRFLPSNDDFTLDRIYTVLSRLRVFTFPYFLPSSLLDLFYFGTPFGTFIGSFLACILPFFSDYFSNNIL